MSRAWTFYTPLPELKVIAFINIYMRRQASVSLEFVHNYLYLCVCVSVHEDEILIDPQSVISSGSCELLV